MAPIWKSGCHKGLVMKLAANGLARQAGDFESEQLAFRLM